MAKKYITKIYPRDIAALSALACCGHVPHDSMLGMVRTKRIDSYVKDGYAERVMYSRPGSGEADTVCYRLTSAGRSLCKANSITDIYHAQNPHHDLGLVRAYEDAQVRGDTWLTETEARSMFDAHVAQLRDQGDEERAQELLDKLQEGALTMPDALVVHRDGTVEAVEVVTNTYGEAEVIAKTDVCQEMGWAYSEVRV